MKRMVRDSDTSSSDDERVTSALKEATDHDFLKESFFNAAQSEAPVNTGKEENTSKLKSLRRNLEEENKYDEFRVTPEFKQFVAKKLSAVLDGIIHWANEEAINGPNGKKIMNVKDNFGVKLLSTSTDFLTTKEQLDCINVNKHGKRTQERKESGDELRRFQEAAVDPEWILSKADTKAWTSKRKDPEFKYKKKKNGILVAQD